MKKIEFNTEYTSKWGLSDFYDDVKEELQNAFDSGEDFTVELACKKEINYATVTRTDGMTVVFVTSWMDDLYEDGDLIYDAVPNEHSGIEFPDEIIDSIIDAAIEDGIEDHTTIKYAPSFSISFNDLVEILDHMETVAEASNDEQFNELKRIVEEHIEYMESKES